MTGMYPMNRKIRNTFEAYQEEKQQRREALIRNLLSVARKSRARFKFVTDLAKMVSAHVTEAEGKECHPATLLRNKRYKALLLSHMAISNDEGVLTSVKGVVEGPAAETALTLSQLEASNLRNENQRLKRHIDSLESALSSKSGNNSQPTSGREKSAEPWTNEIVALQEKYVSTCQVVALLLENMQELLLADVENMEIIDRTRRRNNVIVNARLGTPFFEWLKASPKWR